MKDVFFKSTLNTRSILENDIKYIRSDVPINISENEKDKLLWNNITTIIVVLTSECPNNSCTSFGCAPFDRRLVV